MWIEILEVEGEIKELVNWLGSVYPLEDERKYSVEHGGGYSSWKEILD